jgi:Zn-dependent protease with chaperone function
MKRVLAILAIAACVPCAWAGELLDFRGDLAFQPEAVDRFAARAYADRLQALRLQGALDTDAALLARLHTAFDRVLPVAAEERADAARMAWEIHTCRRCGENASTLAGGRMLVGEEFVHELALDDDELAFLVAHEMAHVLCEHTREMATAARYFLDNGLHREYWDIQRELDGSIGAQLRVGFVAREQELEADRVGFILGAQAGYAPRSMLSLLEKLEPAGASSATHPDRERRVEQAREMLDTARILFQRH